MTDMQKKQNDKLSSNPFDGSEISDSLGRKIRLRKPDALDKYRLFRVMGEDTNIPICQLYAMAILHVATVDGMVFESPTSYSEVEANIKRLKDEGFDAVIDFINKNSSKKTEIEAKEDIKK